MRGWFKIALWQRVLGALVIGVIFGGILSRIMGGEAAADWLETFIKPVGDLFINLIRMLIVPLILTTLVSGVVALGDPKKLGSIGLKTMALYFATTFFANIIGIIFGLLFKPGEGVDLGGADAVPVSREAPTLVERLLGIVPDNPIAALADGDVLAIIFFAVLLGVGILMAGREGKLVGDLFTQAANVILKVTHLVMEVAPFGVFALVAHTVASQGFEALAAIAVLIAAVYVGLITHAVLVYGGFIRFVLGLPVMNFLRGMLDAIAVAYSTASSSATLPVTIANASENLGVKRSIAGSVLPLGATINMDGTALYLGILALFTAQAFGYDLTLANYFLIAFTASIVSIGAAGIPSASLFLLAIVLDTFGVSAEQVAIIVGFILPVDRIMDMARTALNVTGDATVATAVAKWEGELDEDCYRHPADQPYEPKTTPDVADADRD
ncbi:MAG: dicarboxylate/amino acid:cation symporter [Oceanicaulis sp.]|jgi:Na+/H+-dicarboxylate symporter|uniref:dicarboxylate/amino acid:cation symporter n=1 Tax=unclassified Oceanicaulis TaxID=2632123 RepID=UPI0000669841|nr:MULTISPECIES: dicarboxylate/amino acid:cation symporter [unclassified Oceanicaulis]EAP89537.1 proton/glutamate symporter [Oceanicaulis sp. HTCC2633]MAB69134.1 dicarboxylate/amino acid:cation symporter [Oceanicaulis sp.]MBC38790.1 dicarboxylate/amino acid:cation symporter [Oceanicaulis sp.]HBU63676.1 dicarboxylate/amino acid:cation symporter [Oceanicaulis sp.]|tara:strand:+ start:37 stop:1359 length:1323 start_codon:yes stop_codon:yes gene_type:complete